MLISDGQECLIFGWTTNIYENLCAEASGKWKSMDCLRKIRDTNIFHDTSIFEKNSSPIINLDNSKTIKTHDAMAVLVR